MIGFWGPDYVDEYSLRFNLTIVVWPLPFPPILMYSSSCLWLVSPVFLSSYFIFLCCTSSLFGVTLFLSLCSISWYPELPNLLYHTNNWQCTIFIWITCLCAIHLKIKSVPLWEWRASKPDSQLIQMLQIRMKIHDCKWHATSTWDLSIPHFQEK